MNDEQHNEIQVASDAGSETTDVISEDEFDDGEDFTGDELNEEDDHVIGDELGKSDEESDTTDVISEDEFVDGGDFTGDELSEEDEYATGDELDESDIGSETTDIISEDEFIGDEDVTEDELDEDIFSESGLDDTGETDGDHPDDISDDGSKDQKQSQSRLWIKNLNKKKLGKALTAVGIFGILSVTGFFIGNQRTITPVRTTPVIYRQAIPPAELLVFDSFVIPLTNNRTFAYVSMDMTFRLREDLLYREMTEKKYELRGIIYNILTREINKTEELPPLEILKAHIVRGINNTLSTGSINGVFVDQYLAV